MPNRILRDGILTSEAVSSLSWSEEVFYRRLMSVADDHGRFHSLPKLIRAACYPLQIDKVADSDIGKWTTACVAAGLVRVYPATDGKSYLEIVKFGQQVRSKSKFPEPIESDAEHPISVDSNCNQVPADAHLVVSVSEDVGEGRADTRKPPRGSRLPPDWTLPEEWKIEAESIARSDGLSINAVRESLKFRDYWVGKSGKDAAKADWLATWRGWVRRSLEYAGKPTGAPAVEAPIIEAGGWQ